MIQTDTKKIAKRVFNLIILDESGSMTGLEKVSVDGVNETIQTIRSSYEHAPEQAQVLTFVTFSCMGPEFCRTKVNCAPISQVKDFNPSDYRPCGSTPLYDTMGLTLNELEKVVTDSDIVLVTVITDGYENSSIEYDTAAIKALVSRLGEKNWVFTYIGANQDAVLEAGKMGIRNAMNFCADAAGTKAMWEKEKASRASFLTSASMGVSIDNLKENYFFEEIK